MSISGKHLSPDEFDRPDETPRKAAYDLEDVVEGLDRRAFMGLAAMMGAGAARLGAGADRKRGRARPAEP